MPDAPDIVLCSKLCRDNPTDPIRDITLQVLTVYYYTGRALGDQLENTRKHYMHLTT